MTKLFYLSLIGFSFSAVFPSEEWENGVAWKAAGAKMEPRKIETAIGACHNVLTRITMFEPVPV